jgi:hypothetical protein
MGTRSDHVPRRACVLLGALSRPGRHPSPARNRTLPTARGPSAPLAPLRDARGGRCRADLRPRGRGLASFRALAARADRGSATGGAGNRVGDPLARRRPRSARSLLPDLFIAAASVRFSSPSSRERWAAALLVAVLAMSLAPFFLLTDVVPGTVPIAVVLLLAGLRSRRRVPSVGLLPSTTREHEGERVGNGRPWNDCRLDVAAKTAEAENGGGGIRTHGPVLAGQRFSRPPRSTAPAPRPKPV